MITGIILASGFSRRMGQDKLLIKLKDEILIETIIKAAINSDLDKVIIVYRKDEVGDIGKKYNISCVLNENANLGQSESIKLGVESIKEKSDFMFIMGDQPFIDSNLINILIKEYKKTNKNILVPYYNNHKGTPTIIGYSYKEELLSLTGDKGGRDLINKYGEDVRDVYFENRRPGIDIDTLEDLDRIKGWI